MDSTHPRVLQGWTVLHSCREIKQHINEHLLTREQNLIEEVRPDPLQPREAQAGRRRLRKDQPRARLRGQGRSVRSLSVHTNRVL